MPMRAMLLPAAFAAALAAGSGAAQDQPAIPEGYPDDYQEIVEASRSERDLYVYSNITLSIWERLREPFNERYPWINLQPFDLSSAEGIERYLAENGAGSRTADIIITTAPDAWLNLTDRDQIDPYESPEAPHYPDWMNPHPGLYTASADPVMFLWNEMLVPEELQPESFADFVEKVRANPDTFNGRLATMSPFLGAFGYSAFYAFMEHHGEEAWEWLDVIGPMTLGERSAGPIVEKVTTGEYLVAYHLSAAPALRNFDDPQRAALLGWSLISDGTPVLPRGMAVTRGASSPNSARLLLDFFLSREGQIALADGGRVPSRMDVTSEDIGGGYTYSTIVEEIGEENVLPVGYEQDMVDRYGELTERYRAAFAR